MYAIGFTGTRKGLTKQQAEALEGVLQQLMTSWHETSFHHGDCIGADMQAHAVYHDLALEMMSISEIVIHPPASRVQRAFAHKARHGTYTQIPYHLCAEFPYLTRNKHIVDACDILVACPSGPSDRSPGSGTWATVRAALKQEKKVVILYPNGDREGTI